ncbi:hypothetical protein SIID45300_02138 [Candidatus Magnetaquicoccaceae bacterium FCR-1]|uniref:Uncharacterized protein n=1 Tax=Candidatus Magnetaquiglobus chichijimensis TaxID=3141448 RepID=A0ABQ0CA90_9PROT
MKDWQDSMVKVLSSYLKNRNAYADALFYDVDALTASERSQLTPLIEGEGSIVVVSPARSTRCPSIRHYASVEAFFESQDHPAKAIVLAGVGSSVLGAAALARNVANVYQMDVVAVVTGYGMLDIMDEALNGWYFYGAVDQTRMELEHFLDRLPQMTWGMKVAQAATAGEWHKLPFIAPPGDQDTRTLMTLLSRQTGDLRLLLGHSKGSLMISYVLEQFLREQAGHVCLNKLQVVTLGAVTDLPKSCQKKHQFIGTLDWFGGMNSRIGVPFTPVFNAWHHTNTQLPCHLAVEKVLRAVHLLP